jgi:hypothetical protein
VQVAGIVRLTGSGLAFTAWALAASAFAPFMATLTLRRYMLRIV